MSSGLKIASMTAARPSLHHAPAALHGGLAQTSSPRFFLSITARAAPGPSRFGPAFSPSTHGDAP